MAWDHFPDDELKCSCCGEIHMDNNFMSKLVLLRKLCDFPFPISSAYRCPDHNAKVSHTGRTGPHTTGRAVDILVDGARALKIITLAEDMGFTGVGINQKGTGRFIHLDDLEATSTRPRPWLWSY